MRNEVREDTKNDNRCGYIRAQSSVYFVYYEQITITKYKGCTKSWKMDIKSYTEEGLNNMPPLILRTLTITGNLSVEGGLKEIIHRLIENLTGREIKNQDDNILYVALMK